MLGNVWEFPADEYQSYPGNLDGHYPDGLHLPRGGGHHNGPRYLRFAARAMPCNAGFRYHTIGFRLVRTK